MKYVFILGHNPKLSTAEVLAVLPQAKVVRETGSFLIVEIEEIDCQKLQHQLGGTIKIGKIISDKIDKNLIVEELKKRKKENKLNFGLSYYNCNKDKLGMEVKTELKVSGISCRLVVSKDKALSSVVVTKNKAVEFLILERHYLGVTCSVQDFADYSNRDYGRPTRDLVSGSLPPKLAKVMINLAQLPAGSAILDPFCGSGTILQEGLLLGYEMVGSDISEKAVKDTKNNIEWLLQIRNSKSEILNKFKIKNSKLKIFQSDVRNIACVVSRVDAVITEPYLGPPLKGSESRHQISENIEQLSELYLAAFREFEKILDRGGKVVIALPEFRVGRHELQMPIVDKIKKFGFSQINKDKLVYGRPGQKVWRQVYVFERSF